MDRPLTIDRRRHERHVSVQDCKVRAWAATGFAPAQTTNISRGGALLRLPADRPLAAGDPIEIALPQPGRAVLDADRLVRARVRRVIPIDHHHQALGIEFDRALEHEISLAA